MRTGKGVQEEYEKCNQHPRVSGHACQNSEFVHFEFNLFCTLSPD